MKVLRAGWVVPVSGPPIRDGLVAVRGDTVAWVGPARDGAALRGEVRDLGAGVLMPGLVNAHCHLELSHLAGRIESPAGFVPWVEALVAARGEAPDALMEAAGGAAIRDLVQTGTVAVGDVSNSLAHVGMLARSGLAAAVVFYELLSWDPEKASAVLQFAKARVREVAEDLSGMVEVRLAAHAPHSVSAPLLQALAREGGPAAIHLAESPAESAFLRDGTGEWAAFLERRGLGHVAFTPPAASPVAYLENLGVLHPRLVAAHCVQVDDADIRTLALRGVSVVVCPRSNRRLGNGLPPVSALLAAGVGLAIGTDSLASARSLDLMEDVALLHAELPEVAPADLLRMATWGGARALGLPDLGSLDVGRRAALAYAPAARTPADPLEFLVSGARLAPVRL